MINSVCIIGNLAADPEIRSTPGGIKVAKMRIAVNDYWMNKQSGQKMEKTHWFGVSAWDKMADTCERYLRKGMKIAVRGSLEYQEWTAPDNTKRSRVEIRLREMEILTPRSSESRPAQPAYSAQQPIAQPSRQVHPQPPSDDFPVTAIPEEESPGFPGSDYRDEFSPLEDDDIPF